MYRSRKNKASKKKEMKNILISLESKMKIRRKRERNAHKDMRTKDSN